MKFIHRLAYYLGGFSIGLIILAFFLSGKKTSCDYSPDARVLKNIRIKERAFTEEALANMQQYGIDTSAVSSILRTGDVNFRESNTDLDSCKTYQIEGLSADRPYQFVVENCDSLATVLSFQEKR